MKTQPRRKYPGWRAQAQTYLRPELITESGYLGTLLRGPLFNAAHLPVTMTIRRVTWHSPPRRIARRARKRGR